MPAAVPRWALTGFGRTGNSQQEITPRNLMGFKDGTANITAQDSRPLATSSNRKVFRLTRRGNRRMNHAIHMAAITIG